ncbi:hypothetical protein BN2476_230367 [Paraburkholderia piptadeniae]|uniref:Uncharacterized protein n=1 Tax=Paraburkholderia piptadeniae TaxID=1701573 RepID=A0A1N7RY94_9BURK|nr:hypothetical protein BN2476_230367 [Paraburkholderia piptadeniae]
MTTAQLIPCMHLVILQSIATVPRNLSTAPFESGDPALVGCQPNRYQPFAEFQAIPDVWRAGDRGRCSCS